MPSATPISTLAPKSYPDMPELGGVRMATAEAGIKYAGRTDLLVMNFEGGTSVAGVFTRSRCPSAPPSASPASTARTSTATRWISTT